MKYFRPMSRTLRVAAALGGLALAAASLTGCSSSGSSGSDSATSGSVTWWGFNPDASVGKAYIAEFNKAYPDIKVTYKKYEVNTYTAALRPGLVSGNGPDVFNVVANGPTGPLSDFGDFTTDLEPAMEKALGSDWKDKVSATGVEPLQHKGHLAAAALGYVAAGYLWVNQDLFDKFGVKVPTTYDEWKTACETFNAAGVDCFGAGAGQSVFNDDTLHTIADSIEPGYWSAAQQGKRKWTEDTMVKTLQVWSNLQKDKIMEEGALGFQQFPDINNRFLQGKVAMVQMGSWYRQYATTEGAATALSAAGATGKPFTMLPVSFPDVGGAGHPATTFADADYGLAVNNRSKHQKAAATFATWLATSKAGQQVIADKLDLNPALTSAKPNWSKITLVDQARQQPAFEALNAAAAEATEPRYGYESASLAEAIFNASTSVLEGKASPKDAAATLQAASTK